MAFVWLLSFACFSCSFNDLGPPVQKTSSNDIEKDRYSRFENQIEELRVKLKIPGISAVIVKDQKPIWMKGFGSADLENKIPATPETNYRIASLTKTFASTLLMQLVEQGKLDLNDPMSKFSAEFQKRFNNDSITVRQVFTHTSHGNPGEAYSYNGNRFSYLSDVVEKASGVSFRELLVKNILDKIEMTGTVPGQNILDETANRPPWLDAGHVKRYENGLAKLAKPYRLYGTEIIQTVYPSRRISTSAGLISNVIDLAKYDAAVDRHNFIKTETQTLAWTPAGSTNGNKLPYGLGWFIQQAEALKLIWHYGYWPDSFSSLILKAPERNITFILLANSDGLSAPFPLGGGDVLRSPFAVNFLRIFVHEEMLGQKLPDPSWSPDAEQFSAEIEKLRKSSGKYRYEYEQAANALVNRWLKERREQLREEVKVDPKHYDNFVGEYELGPNELLTISREGDRLFFQSPGTPKAEAYPESETRFFLKVRDVRLNFMKGSSGKVSHLEATVWGQRLKARKVK